MEAKKYVWEGAIPLQIHLHESDITTHPPPPPALIHLFDIDIPGKITFMESKTLTAGKSPTVVDTDVGRIGIGICYDIRFQELAMIYAARGFYYHQLNHAMTNLRMFSFLTLIEFFPFSSPVFLPGSLHLGAHFAMLSRSIQHDHWNIALGVAAESKGRV